MTRAERRHRRVRAVARMERFIRRTWRLTYLPPGFVEMFARKRAGNRQCCRQGCCCNERRASGPSIRERRAATADEWAESITA